MPPSTRESISSTPQTFDLELAFSWHLSKPMVASVIAGATSADQVRANANAGTWHLSDLDPEKINTIAPVKRA
jgi:aryl-alcohol dehydrogenase-like predicted oxidoreductase